MAKRNRRSGHHPHRRRSVDGPDDVIELPFGVSARWGRFITTENTLTEEEHSELVAALIEGAHDVQGSQVARRDRLMEIFDTLDAIDLLARASLNYLHIDPDTFKEWESDRSPAHIEYLALQALSLEGSSPPDAVDPMEASALTGEAIHLAREMFRDATHLTMVDAVRARSSGTDEALGEYAFKTRLHSLGIRSMGYAEHVERVIDGCLGPFTQECRDLLGFAAEDALLLTDAIVGITSDRIAPRAAKAAEIYRELVATLKRDRRKRASATLPGWLLDLSPTEAKRHAAGLASMFVFEHARQLALVSAGELSEETSLALEVCEAFLRAFSCPSDAFVFDHHAFPCGAHPLTTHPILDAGNGQFLLVVPSSMIEAVRPRMEDLLAETGLWERYAKSRANYLEREATRLVASALPGSRSWVGIPWASENDNSDLDGLVAADDLTVRLQCKAGRLSAPTRRGATGRMVRDIGDLIEAASNQHVALSRALSSDDAKRLGFDADQATSLRAMIQIEAVVCLDDVTVWSTETHELRRIDALPMDRDVPWVLSLTDLMAVVDLLHGAQFAHYLIRRRRIERDGRVSAHDELDWVGHYVMEGLFFDRFFEGERPPDKFRLLSYTEPIDAWYFTRAGVRTQPAPKPAQDIPAHLEALLNRLESERPRHWLTASIALLDGDDEARATWDAAIAHARDRIGQVGWSNATQGLDGHLGVTLMVDLRVPWPRIRRQVRAYCERKADETGERNWVGIGEGASGGLFVELVERDDDFGIADGFTTPPEPRTGHH